MSKADNLTSRGDRLNFPESRRFQVIYDVVPRLSTFGKAMGNGFAISALAGKREIMQLGGLDHASDRAFSLSTTHDAETHALAAARATLDFYKASDVIAFLYQQVSAFEPVSISASCAIGSQITLKCRGGDVT